MSPFGAWFMVSEQLHDITNREETFDFSNKKCRIHAACGVSQTPKKDIRRKENHPLSSKEDDWIIREL
jgi:hypothetical protein